MRLVKRLWETSINSTRPEYLRCRFTPQCPLRIQCCTLNPNEYDRLNNRSYRNRKGEHLRRVQWCPKGASGSGKMSNLFNFLGAPCILYLAILQYYSRALEGPRIEKYNPDDHERRPYTERRSDQNCLSMLRALRGKELLHEVVETACRVAGLVIEGAVGRSHRIAGVDGAVWEEEAMAVAMPTVEGRHVILTALKIPSHPHDCFSSL